MTELIVSLGSRSYPIVIGKDILSRLQLLLNNEVKDGGKIALVTDSNVNGLYAEAVKKEIERAGYDCTICVLPAGEEHKRLARIEELCGHFLEAGLDRSSLVVALGGGIVGDVAGFAAASYMRGIDFIQIPTTIVAQVDSSVGGKTGVNHPLGKNTIGAFHQPVAVLIDLNFLKTLPARELRAGLAEVLKHGVIADEELFAYLEQHADDILNMDLNVLQFPIIRSCEIKSAVVAADEQEHGLRANLNYGHTFGHGFEAVTQYRQFLHGEAVAMGMQAAAICARILGMVDDNFVERQQEGIKRYGLPVGWADLPVEQTMEAMQHDKKVRKGVLKFILPKEMGAVVQRTDVPLEVVRQTLDAIRKNK